MFFAASLRLLGLLKHAIDAGNGLNGSSTSSPDLSSAKPDLPLIYAIQHSDVATMRTLLEAGAGPNKPLPGTTILWEACQASGVDTIQQIQALFEYGVDPSGQDRLTAIRRLIQGATFNLMQQMEIIRLLLSRLDKDSTVWEREGRNLLSVAVVARNIEALKCLLEHSDIDVNLRDKDDKGFSPLIHAVVQRSLDVFEVLFDRQDLDVNASDSEGRTALSHAVIPQNGDSRLADHRELIRRLLLHPGIDVNTRDNRGFTTLMRAILREKDDEFEATRYAFQQLLERPDIDVHQINNSGHCVLSRAVYRWVTPKTRVAFYAIQQLSKRPDIDVDKNEAYKKHSTEIMVHDVNLITPRLIASFTHVFPQSHIITPPIKPSFKHLVENDRVRRRRRRRRRRSLVTRFS